MRYTTTDGSAMYSTLRCGCLQHRGWEVERIAGKEVRFKCPACWHILTIHLTSEVKMEGEGDEY